MKIKIKKVKVNEKEAKEIAIALTAKQILGQKMLGEYVKTMKEEEIDEWGKQAKEMLQYILKKLEKNKVVNLYELLFILSHMYIAVIDTVVKIPDKELIKMVKETEEPKSYIG